MRVGAQEPRRVDTRLICAANGNLRRQTEDGSFRLDFFFRINAVTIELPPLRQRITDLPALIDYFLEIHAKAFHRDPKPLSREMLGLMRQYKWPGNIRQLENVIERIVLLSRSDEVTASDLPDNLRARTAVEEISSISVETEGLSLEAVERELIIQALRKFNWNQTHAARHLDISRKALMYRIAKYGIEKSTPQSQLEQANSAGGEEN